MDAATRQAGIVAAAREAFAAQPYEQVSMAAIAEGAGASEALLYRYYSSKAELYTAVVRDLITESNQAQQAAEAALSPGQGGRERVSAALDAYLDGLAAPGSAASLLLPGNDPAEAITARAELNAEHVDWLREVSGATAAEEYALQGYVGFVTVASRVWVERGCPAGERDQLRQAALDALFSWLFTSEAARAEQRRSKFRR